MYVNVSAAWKYAHMYRLCLAVIPCAQLVSLVDLPFSCLTSHPHRVDHIILNILRQHASWSHVSQSISMSTCQLVVLCHLGLHCSSMKISRIPVRISDRLGSWVIHSYGVLDFLCCCPSICYVVAYVHMGYCYCLIYCNPFQLSWPCSHLGSLDWSIAWEWIVS